MTAATSKTGRHRPIQPGERSGVLHPENLNRYGAGWFDPDPAVSAVVDQYWHVHWSLPAGDSIDQRIIDLPAVTLTAEEGNVPAPLVVTGVQSRAWKRRITGAGSVFAIRLRPAGLAVLSDLSPQQIADGTLPLTPQLDPRLFRLLSHIADAGMPEARARLADAAISALIDEAPPGPELLLANAILVELSSRIPSRTGASVAEALGVSERTIQRALRSTLGHGPKWVSRRIRLQEVARALASDGSDNLAALATDLGYADQAHLTSDFRNVAGITPAAYVRSIRSRAGTAH